MSTLRVGFGKTDINPIEPCDLGGLGGPWHGRVHDGILDSIYTICVAITDEKDNTILLISNDLCQLQVMEGMKDPIVQATGVPAENIYVSCTHTHSAPATYPEVPEIERYLKFVALKMAVAAAQAIADRKPAAMEFAKTETENMTFSRRYLNTVGGIFTNINGTIRLGPEEEPDNFLQLLRFKRQGGKDILLSNFQGHYHGSSTAGTNRTKISANFPGAYRDKLEEKTGCHAVYFSGAGGNLAVQCVYHKERNVSSDYIDHGYRLAAYALDDEVEFTPLKAGEIQNRSLVYTGLTKKEPEHLEAAKKVVDYYEETGDKEGATKMCKESGLDSIHHAGAVVSHMKKPDTFDVTLKAISIGDLAIVTAPCEMYSSIGENVKAASPYKATLVFQLTDGSIGYIPSNCAYAHGGYEVSTTPFKCGIADGYHETFMTMLQDMYEKQ